MRNLALPMIVAFALVGCAPNPIVKIDAPGLATRLTDPDPSPGQPMTFANAHAFALKVRATYREQIYSQAEQSQILNSGLLLLGASVIGLAAGGANSNIILGTSLAGGTMYALGTINLDKRRLLILSAGMRAVDCADSAVLPLDVGTQRRTDLVNAANGLRTAIATVRRNRAAVQRELDKVGTPSKPDEVAAQAALNSTDIALTEADKSLRAGEKLISDIDDAGKRLQQTVLEITQKVDAAMLDTLVDISAIPQLVAGLGGFASAFAPGAGLEKLVAANFANYDKETATKNAGQPVPKAGDPLADAMKDLQSSVQEMQRQAGQVNDLVAGVDSSKIIDALKACDVTGVAFALAVDPVALEFTAKTAASKGFTIAGGTKPYTVRALDAFPDALTIAFDGGFSDTAQIKLGTAEVSAGTYRVLVADSSNPKRTQQVNVQIGAAKGSDLSPTPSNQKETLDSLGQALVKTKTTVKDIELTVDGAKVGKEGKLELTVSCKPPDPPTPLKAEDVKTALLAADKVAKIRDKLKEATVLDDKLSQIVFKPANPNCFK